MKLLVSGGHLTPALSLVDYAVTQHDQVVFVGRQYSQTHQRSHEEAEVSARGVTFVPFSSGKLGHHTWPEFFKNLNHFGRAVLHARHIMQHEKPDVFVSFGGYLAVPLALAAWSLGIPIITHEQTRTAGIANRFIAFFAQKVAISFPETTLFFPVRKTTLTGNPVRSAVFQSHVPTPNWFPASSLPILYVAGGSQGAKVVNEVIAQTLPDLTRQWFVIHACGPATAALHYREFLTQEQEKLPPNLRSNYVVREWFSEPELGWIYQHATAIVTRAGANTVSEIIRAGKPAILIPLPFAHGDEQRKNAEAIVHAGAGILLPQTELSAMKFIETLADLSAQLPELQKKATVLAQSSELQADQKFYQLIKELSNEKITASTTTS